MCLNFEDNEWKAFDGDLRKDWIDENGHAHPVVYHCDHGITGNPPSPLMPCQGHDGDTCYHPAFPPEPERTYVEWELSDLNGDGYPDFVFNSSPTVYRPQPYGPSDPRYTYVGPAHNNFGPASTNLILASFNNIGVRFQDDERYAFSQSRGLNAARPDFGVGMWEGIQSGSGGSFRSIQRQRVGHTDVNGDGLVDRVIDTDAYLGTYSATWTFSNVHITLPGPMASQSSEQEQDCAHGLRYTSGLSQGLRDLTGDGIPDYFSGGRVWIGTGARFAPPVPFVISGANFAFSHQTEACDGSFSNTDGGLFDLNGDGRPDGIGLVPLPNGGRAYVVSELTGGSAPGVPEAGMVTVVENGHGARTRITYRSAKEDVYSSHQVPFPEIVVASVETTGTRNLGGTLLGERRRRSRPPPAAPAPCFSTSLGGHGAQSWNWESTTPMTRWWSASASMTA